MGLFRSSHRPLRKDCKRKDRAVALDEFGSLELDGDLVQQLNAEAPDPDRRPAIRVRPFKDNDGIESGIDFLESIYDVERGGFRSRKNVSPAHSFEIRFTNERVNFQFVPAERWVGTFERQLQDKYPNALIERSKPETLSFAPGEYVAGAELDLALYTLFPIEHIGLEGWRRDPFGGIVSEMVGTRRDGQSGADVLVQVVFRPQSRDWVHGVNGGPDVDLIAHNLNQPTIKRERRLFTKTTVEHPPSDIEKKAAKIIRDQHGDRAWNVNIRVFAVSEDELVARRRVKKASTQFENYYECATEQMFVPKPLSGRKLKKNLNRLVRREWTDRGIVKSEQEAGGVIHIPNAEINQQNVEWALSKPGEGIPPGTPRFDFDAADVSMASKDKKQLAMIDTSGPGDPFWLGWGSKNRIEAGVFEHNLNAHMFVGGGTRKGKTTFLTNFASQAFQRDYGALVVTLGKQDDDEEFIAEWPQDRPKEDFVFIDTGDDFEEMVRFNLLEVPDELEPGTVAHSSYVESLADDMAAAFSQSGGSDNYWGALMSRVTRTLIRGMSLSEMNCTPIDLAAACSSQENLEQFAEWMSDERIDFIRETAERIQEKSDDDLEPLAGRMDNITHNASLRTLLSAREPTVRIQDIVDDGKIAVLRIDPSLGETERNFITTPLVRRFYNARKMSEVNDDPYFVIWDEFDKSVTKQSNVAQMLSEAGGYGLWFVLACQAPSHQLPEEITRAIGSQVETFVSFGTGDEDARYIARQHTLDPDDLSNLSRYTFYIRTHDEHDDLTHSYRVDAFPPIREVRGRVGDDNLMSQEEIHDLKERSVKSYGDIPETPAEIKAESHFFTAQTDEDPGLEDATPGVDGLDMSTDHCRNQALKAIYDESIRQGDPGGWVSVGGCVERLGRYLPDGETAISSSGKAWRKVLQKIPDAYLDHREVDDEMQVRALDTGFMNLGDTENDGNPEHWAPMADAYIPMTQLGFIFEIPAQTGDEMPDGLARLDDVLDLEGLTDPDAIADAVATYRDENPLLDRLAGAKDIYIESEHTTGSTQPSQTVKNLAQAHNNGHRCLFLCREDVAPKVDNTVGHEPFCCRSSHSVDGERRFYTGTTTLSIDGETMTRPGSRENVWVHDENTGEYILRDDAGTVHARFDTAEDIFSDASAYPSDGDRNIKPPVIPEYEFDGELEDVGWDVIVVQSGATTPLDLSVYDDGEQTPIVDLLEEPETSSSSSSSASESPSEGTPIDKDTTASNEIDETSTAASAIDEAASLFD